MHTDAILKIAISADGRLLATGSADKTLRLWSLPDAQLVRVFRMPIGAGFNGRIYALAMSPDGRTLAVYAAAYEPVAYVHLYDIVTGELVKKVGPLPDVVGALAFSHDGKRLAAGLNGGHGIRVWQAPFDGVAREDTQYGGDVNSLAFDRAGRLGSVAADGLIRLYDRNLKLFARRSGSSDGVPFDLAFSPKQDVLAVASYGTPRVELVSAKSLKHAAWTDSAGLPGMIGAVAWSSDGKQLYGGGTVDDGSAVQVVAWSDGGRGRPQPLPALIDSITDLEARLDGGVAFTSSDPGFGILGAPKLARSVYGPVTADMRLKIADLFQIAHDATGVRFGLKEGAREPWRFDLAMLDFKPSPQPPAGYVAPDTRSLPISGWPDRGPARLGEKVLALEEGEQARSLAIAADGQGFVLGADWSISRYDAEGNRIWRMTVPNTAWGVALSADGQILVAAMGDGTIRWFRMNDGQLLLSFFVHVPDKRWIAWTATGYYAASPGGEDLIGWHVNRSWHETPDFFPAARFHDRYYRPDIVGLVLGMLDETKAVEEANRVAKRRDADAPVADLLPPVIEIIDPAGGAQISDPKLTLHYRLRSPSGQAVTRIDVLIDGRPLAGRAAMVIAPDEENVIEVAVPRRDCEISLIAVGEKTTGLPASIKVTWAGTAAAPPNAKLYAVLVGVSAYADPALKLTYADDDARDLDTLLHSQEGRQYGLVETRLLVDEKATAANILDALTWLEQTAGSDDTAILFFAGHGLTDERQRFYFLPVEATPDASRLRSSAISEAQLRDAIGAIAGKVLFFIDACHSGQAIDGALSTLDATAVVNSLSRAETGVVMFSSSTGREVSIERPEWQNGAFTESLIAGLGGKADYVADGEITTDEINLFLSAEVTSLTEGAQNAVMVRPRTIKDFAFIRIN
jgi:WD40 repeat protein